MHYLWLKSFPLCYDCLCVGTKYKSHTTFFSFMWSLDSAGLPGFGKISTPTLTKKNTHTHTSDFLSKTIAHTDHRPARLRYSIQKMYAFFNIKGMFLCLWVFSISVKRIISPKNHTGIITKWFLTCTSPVSYLLACLEKCF